MNIEFDQEPGDTSSKGGGSNTRLLLLVLLLLVAVFGYLFYFTDIIKPRQEVQAPAPVQPSQVKQPIPPRPAEQPAGVAPVEPAKPAAVSPPAAGQPEPAKVAQEQKAPEKAKAEPPAPVKSAVPPTKKEQPKPAEPAKAPVAKKEQPKPVKAPVEAKQKALQAKPDDKQKAAASSKEAKHAAPVKPKAAAARKVAKKAVAGKSGAKASSVKASAAPVAGEYTLRIGEYVVPSAMEKDNAKVREAGLTPVVKEGNRKKEPMIRLLFGEFADQETARKELQKLRDATVEGFILNEGGKYRVYAGSYFVKARATQEQQRLEALGYKLTFRKANVSVPVLLLTAGKYGSRAEALKDVSRLKKRGLSAAVIANVK
ncbi:SPOR domain-containing protein [Geobacter grbiciae]|uniref:SPOR domain-containing protein n=1 Tax=Geobacter grbiciae TaxID=155042 RepID=UPI001C01C85B|nr:SPOR domain-containing protein [Geobacter grbiciae]MBT1074629.1 SPOR domain-containing protein [Geobacter grbiciae]